MSLAGVHSRCARCDAGMCSATVVWPPRLWLSGVAGHALVGREGLHQGVGDAQLDRGAHEPVRHAVVVGIELDVVVDVDLGGLPAADLVARGRQRLERRGVELLEGAAPAAGELLEGALVQIDEQLGDGAVELGQAEESAVAQPRQDPSLDHEHRSSRLWACRADDAGRAASSAQP